MGLHVDHVAAREEHHSAVQKFVNVPGAIGHRSIVLNVAPGKYPELSETLQAKPRFTCTLIRS